MNLLCNGLKYVEIKLKQYTDSSGGNSIFFFTVFFFPKTVASVHGAEGLKGLKKTRKQMIF